MMSRLTALGLLIWGAMAVGVAASDLRYQPVGFSDLKGWADDDHAAALSVFRSSCTFIKAEGWAGPCKAAGSAKDARRFFEAQFQPVVITDGKKPLFTGYYEPELPASRRATGPFQYPIYRVPPEMPKGQKWHSRGELEDKGILKGRGLEIAYLADPVEVFFLQVQGSGRLRLTDGSAMRVGFAAKNGHKYRSVGREMARKGLLPANKVSAGRIKSWVRENPGERAKVLWHNPSYIFFREVKGLSDGTGPIGAMGKPVTALRSIAVDRSIHTLGGPVWVEKDGKAPIRRLMIAQDTGSAIKGAQRADVFYGSGKSAGDKAGKIRDGGRMVMLLPKSVAARLTGGG